jgi:uncharacterized protein
MTLATDLIEDKRRELETLCEKYGVACLYLFGSAVNGNFDESSSDLDFVADFSDRTPTGSYADRYFGFIEGLESLFGRSVDLVMVQAIKNPYFKKAVEQTKTLLYAA